MRNFNSYEDAGYSPAHKSEILEGYRGTDIVGWYSNIEAQLVRMLDEQEGNRNFEYADKLRNYLKTWRDNEITGSINREDVAILKATAEGLAVDNWGLNNYFTHLKSSLARLIASEEELPRGMDAGANDPFGGGSPGGGGPSLSPEFGSEAGEGDGDLDFDSMDGEGDNSGAGVDGGSEPSLEELDKE